MSAASSSDSAAVRDLRIMLGCSLATQVRMQGQLRVAVHVVTGAALHGSCYDFGSKPMASQRHAQWPDAG